jgi:hypothetical protein
VPGTLNYSSQKIHTDEASIKDLVSVDVTNITSSGRTDQTYHFLTGKINVPTSHVAINRVMEFSCYFLRGMCINLKEKQKVNGDTSSVVFVGLWLQVVKKLVQTSYKGKQVESTQYTIQPCEDDKKSTRWHPIPINIILLLYRKKSRV